MQATFKPVLMLEAAIDQFDNIKKDDSVPPQAKLAALIEKRVQPAMKLEKVRLCVCLRVCVRERGGGGGGEDDLNTHTFTLKHTHVHLNTHIRTHIHT